MSPGGNGFTDAHAAGSKAAQTMTMVCHDLARARIALLNAKP
jgi:hypothetical protein